MTPGTTTGPGENKEILDRRAEETTNHGEQVRHTRNFCERLTKNDPTFTSLVEEYHQGRKTKSQLQEKFKDALRTASPEKRRLMGLVGSGTGITDAEIGSFLSTTKCFDNQLMSLIDSDHRAKEKAHENMIENCLEVTHDEYGEFDEKELKKALKKEDNSRLRTFLENPKYRKIYINKLPGSHALREKDFSDINFDEITRDISKLDPTHPKRREIQEAWLKISQIGDPNSNLAEAFHKITHGGGPKGEIAGDYRTFFSDENTLISRANREKILNFLTQQYTPIIPLNVLEALDPVASKYFLTSIVDRNELSKDLPADPELATALKKDREEQWEKIYKTHIGGGTNMIGSRSLPFETKIKILSEFGSAGRAEKMVRYYGGKPGSLRSSTDTEGTFRKKFQDQHPGLDPEMLETKTGLRDELVARLGHRVEGIENFEPGCAMEWTTRDKKTKEETTAYFIIDTVPGDTLDEENILTVRFLGDNKDPLSPTGLIHHYTGADFYHYLDGCSEDGKIVFRDRGQFDAEMESNTTGKKLPRYHTQEETQAELRNQFPETVEVMSLDSLNYEVDQVLNPHNQHPREAKSPAERKLDVGMIFCKMTKGRIDTFQIADIDEDAGTITLWDGWGSKSKSPKNKSIMTMSFTQFVNTLKHLRGKVEENGLYRLPIGKKEFGIKEFNQLCLLDTQYEGEKDGGIFKKMSQVRINEDGGANAFGQVDPKTGIFSPMPIVKIGEKKDLYIESVDGTTVTYRIGTFTQAVYDEKKDKWTQKPEFSGSPVQTMSLAMLWAYLHENKGFKFEKPLQEAKKKEEKTSGKLGWWNILMHAHSVGVILHGDLWKAPIKAWEEQHHKDHAFHGKLTAALAMEKLKSGNYGLLSRGLSWAEWPSLMVADGSSSIQSYLEELVNKIDGMSSVHRTNLIKKWGKYEHFPSPKFMAAMFASMQIFGQLYPYDDGAKDPRKQQWFWYNSIVHSLDPNHSKYPHMPPHDGDKWPEYATDTEGNTMTEIQVCHKLFNSFKHPLLTNLGRRFQKYSTKGQENLKAGGTSNLNERTTMEGKLDWMMNTVLGQKIPEAFGDATELWFKEGYSTEITTMPAAAALFGCREQQMLPQTQEAIKKEFQENGIQVPMFVFMQSKNLGDTFRETAIAFAYTMGSNCGNELAELVKESTEGRLTGDNRERWRKRFEAFWRKNGTELMHKLSGMKDPMLNLMINEPVLFEKMLDDQPADKKKEYQKLREKSGVIRAYYGRIRSVFDSPDHCHMDRNKAFYTGDNFRYRDSFDIGYPIAWVNWDNYLDGNLDKEYAAGRGATSGDGIFNEIRGFMYDIPDLAEKMAIQMGFTGEKKRDYIHKISKSLFEKNRDQMKRLLEQLIKAEEPDAEYCSMTAMMLGLMDVRKLVKGGATSAEDTERYADYFTKMKEVRKKAEKIEETDYAEGIRYRAKMATKWSQIVRAQKKTNKCTIDDIYNASSVHDLEDDNVGKLQKNTQSHYGTVLQEKKDKHDERREEPDNIIQFPGAAQRGNSENDSGRKIA